MQPLTIADLLGLEQYARERSVIRGRMIKYRAARRLVVGPSCSWSFEDRETIAYQVHEMLRAERVFEPAGIADELAAYNPLVPDGQNLKATFLVEIPDPVERERRLRELRGVERCCWLQVAGFEHVLAIADEDLERESGEKTSAVHFLRFELGGQMIGALRAGAALSAGVSHRAYHHEVAPVPPGLRASLLGDFA
jgi:hypothetical protein